MTNGIQPPSSNTKTYLPSENSNSDILKSKGSSKWQKALQIVKHPISYMRQKTSSCDIQVNTYEPLNEKKETKLSDRTITPYIANLPATIVPFAEISPPDSIEEKRQMAVEASISAYAYHRSTEKISDAGNIQSVTATPDEWGVSTEFINELAEKTGLTPDKEKGMLYDKKTGLVAYILQQKNSNEMRLVFGGTTSGLHTGGLLKRTFVSNPKFTLRQWKSNIQNALGMKSPKNFEQAKQLTSTLKKTLDESPHHQKTHLVLSGHSKGGAEATYAALSQNEPLEARVFSSAELHQQLINQIPTTNLKQACEKVVCVNIKGDMVPNMSKVLPTQLKSVGSCINLKPAHFYNVERHDSYVKHVRYFAETQTKV